MKIVEIIPNLTSGGAERFTVDLCNELVKRHEVWLVLFFPLDNSRLQFLLPEVNSRVHVVSLNKPMGFDWRMVRKLAHTLHTVAPQVVHCHGRAFPYTFMAQILGRVHSRFFYTVHNDAQYDAGRWPLNRMRRYAFRHRFVTPVTISEESLHSFRDYYGMTAPMILNGRALPAFHAVRHADSTERTRASRTLVCLARFSSVKRQDMLARIALQLQQEGYLFTLQLIGRHEDSNILAAVQTVNCPCIEIVGEVSNPVDYLNKADAFCLCSTYEGMPISLIEAMSVGAVPVCTPVGGIVNMVKDGENGFLSEDLSEKAYHKALKRFLDTPKEAIEEMRRQAVAAALPYSMEECAKKYEQLMSL